MSSLIHLPLVKAPFFSFSHSFCSTLLPLYPPPLCLPFSPSDPPSPVSNLASCHRLTVPCCLLRGLHDWEGRYMAPNLMICIDRGSEPSLLNCLDDRLNGLHSSNLQHEDVKYISDLIRGGGGMPLSIDSKSFSYLCTSARKS